LQDGDFGLFDHSVRKLCPNYFDLLPILAKRSSSKPKALSDEVIESDYESDDGNKKVSATNHNDNHGIDDNEKEQINNIIDNIDNNVYGTKFQTTVASAASAASDDSTMSTQLVKRNVL
jgi:hypothetical protein